MLPTASERCDRYVKALNELGIDKFAGDLTAEETAERRALLVSCQSNAAACWLKLGNPMKAESNCSQVLSSRPSPSPPPSPPVHAQVPVIVFFFVFVVGGTVVVVVVVVVVLVVVGVLSCIKNLVPNNLLLCRCSIWRKKM